MHSTNRISLAVASVSIAALALVGCSSPAPESSPPETVDSVIVDAPEETAPESIFEDSVLTTPEVTIKITDVKTIAAGEVGNEYSDVPVIAFWYEVTNVAGEDVTPSEWLFSFTAYQDNDPNVENELNVGSLPDDSFLDTQMEKIKQGGTVANAVAYELTDTTTPVKLVASDDLGMTEIGTMTFELK
ncbi:DUF5067 domain-containing protein [Microbacterium sp. TWP3-1-2b2]|uniref:DUF5067 domain-containing protein n=1 Tax=Microbacterium sp. TWP3-1-2b2 TaxID=2804651 RepID=UPI003CF0491B